MTDTDRARARFDALFRAHSRAVLGYALRRVDEPADAADVVAEAFLAAWRRLERVPDGPEARLWLLGAARRALANQRRGRRRRDALAERLHDALATLAPAEPDAVGHEVRDALAALRRDDREVLGLVCWEGLAPAEAAQVLGIPAATARTRLHRARARMTDELARRGVVPAGRTAPIPVEAAR